MRRTAPLFLVAFLAACTTGRNDPAPKGEGAPPEGKAPAAASSEKPLPAWSSEMPRAEELSGQKIAVASEGPWSVRRGVGAAPAGPGSTGRAPGRALRMAKMAAPADGAARFEAAEEEAAAPEAARADSGRRPFPRGPECRARTKL